MPEAFHQGQVIADYVLDERLGAGGFGTVWRAHARNGQVVAIKLIDAEKASLKHSARLRSEIELLAAAASKESANVVRVIDTGVDVVPFIVMEYIDGTSLQEELESRGTLTQADTINILQSVANALNTLEKSGIIHRDVKPGNVMIGRDGSVKLADFGIAKIVGYDSVTVTGQLPLSAAYAAPEVWAGEPTHQSDLYALGVMAFQCLTGARPFNGSLVQLYEAHRNQQPPLNLVPDTTVPVLGRLIGACLEKEAAKRPPDAAAVLAMVRQAAAELTDVASARGVAQVGDATMVDESALVSAIWEPHLESIRSEPAEVAETEIQLPAELADEPAATRNGVGEHADASKRRPKRLMLAGSMIVAVLLVGSVVAATAVAARSGGTPTPTTQLPVSSASPTPTKSPSYGLAVSNVTIQRVGTQLFTAAFDYVYDGNVGPTAVVYADSGLGGCVDATRKQVQLDMDKAYNHDHQSQVSETAQRATVIFRWNGGVFGSVSNPVTCDHLLLDMATMDGNQEFHMSVPVNPVILDGAVAKY